MGSADGSCPQNATCAVFFIQIILRVSRGESYDDDYVRSESLVEKLLCTGIVLLLLFLKKSVNIATMLPFETTNIFEQLPRFVFKMPRVVPDQEGKFQSDELFRRLCRESEVRYTGYRDRPMEERQMRFQSACRDGHTEVSFIATGTNLQLMFSPSANGYSDGCDFNKEQGKVHIKSCFIMNGVCVRWRGWLDLERLDGVGCLEYDEERAQMEDAVLREQIERYNQRLRDFEEKQRVYRAQHERHVEAEVEVRASRLGRNRVS